VGEIGVDRQGLLDAELLHDHEAQTVHKAVVLVSVPRKIREGLPLLFGGGLVDATEDTGEELLTDLDCEVVADAGIAVSLGAHEGDGLRDHVIGGEESSPSERPR
jgi:hypothetical protein